jgi:high-affinity iron transporter
MIGQFLLTFREVLEAALITSITLAYLLRMKRRDLARFVWLGVTVAAAASVVLGIAIWFIYGSLSQVAQVLFEGAAAILAVIALTSMILWLATTGRQMRHEVEKRVESIATRGARLSVVSFSFIVVLREGFETVLFLTPFLVNDTTDTILGMVLGLIASVAFSYGVFVVGMRIDMRRFFYLTSVLLVLLAGGLAGYGVHELIEYAELASADLGWFSEYAYRLDVPSGSLLHDKGLIGSILAVLFGYTVSAEWGRLLVHLGYLMFVLPLVLRAYAKE